MPLDDSLDGIFFNQGFRLDEIVFEYIEKLLLTGIVNFRFIKQHLNIAD
jgi:hypothetical protein